MLVFRIKIILLSSVVLHVVGLKMSNPLLYIHRRIVGGRSHEDTTETPYIVSIQLCNIHTLYGHCPVRNQQHECGGGLLNKYFVITACHCVADVRLDSSGPAEPSSVKVRHYSFLAGTSYLHERGPHAQIRYARKLRYHPKCATIEGSVLYDLGLAEMVEPFDVNEYVTPLLFYVNDDDLERKVKELEHFRFTQSDLAANSSHVTVAGWGDVRPGQHEPATASSVLNSVKMYVVPEEDCLEAYSKRDQMYRDFSFHKYNQICAVGKYGNTSDCVGDSGSPVTRDGYLIAIVSYGYECASDLPSVYQTTATLSSWFRRHIRPKIKPDRTILNTAGAYHFPNVHTIIALCLSCCMRM